MHVQLINSPSLENGKFFERWGVFTSVCYSKGVPSLDGNMSRDTIKIAQHCLSAGHLSGCRHIYFDFVVTGVSRACTHQLVRHTQGIVFNQQSLRYVNPFDAGGVGFVYPVEAYADPMIKFAYDDIYRDAEAKYKKIETIMLSTGCTPERARECARYTIPMAVQSSMTMSLNLEAAINLCKKRECKRAEQEFQSLANLIHAEMTKAVPELDSHLGPPCKIGLNCKEKKCPG